MMYFTASRFLYEYLRQSDEKNNKMSLVMAPPITPTGHNIIDNPKKEHLYGKFILPVSYIYLNINIYRFKAYKKRKSEQSIY
jgi:hypothetical protein